MMDVEFKAKALERVPGLCNKGDWVYGSLVVRDVHGAKPYIIGMIDEMEEGFISPEFWVAVDKKTIGQNINKVDRKGNDIFEGDIVLCFRMEGAEEIIGVVKYNAIHCCFEVCGRKVNGDKNRIVLTMRQCWNIRCVGNIHDNPELMYR